MSYQNIFIERDPENGDPRIVHLWDCKDGYLTFPYAEFAYCYRRNDTGEKKSLFGFNVTKTFSFSRKDTGLLESDILPEMRVLTDTYIDSDEPSIGHRILFLDIEVEAANGYPDPEKAGNEIYSIALYDGVTKEYTVLVSDAKNRSVTLPNATVHTFASEELLLDKFLEVWESINPTIVSGWNSEGFDIPYLYNRIKNVFGKHEAGRLSPIGIVKYSRSKETYQIAGVSHLDYRWLYKKFTYTEQPNYRLDTIGKIELEGFGKVEYDSTLDELFASDLKMFLTYNIRDVEILVELDAKLQLIDLVRAICHIGHVPYEDYWYPSRYIDGAILTYLHRKDIVAPNKPLGGEEKYREQKESLEEGFIGAYVKDVTPGLYSWVYSLDLQSLYPSIIMSLNISTETKIARISNWNVEKHIRKEIPEYVLLDSSGIEGERLSPKEFAEFMTDGKFTIASNGTIYRTDVAGVIPEILSTWFVERMKFQKLLKEYKESGDKVKAEYYNKRQHIQKILLNSVFGALGLPTWRYYDIDNAEAVTTTGRDVIQTTAKFINQTYRKTLRAHGLNVEKDMDYITYIDTDSVFSSMEPLLPVLALSTTPTLDDANIKQFTIQWAKNLENSINEFYDGMALNLFSCEKHRFFIKGESVARSAFWVEKKRYTYRKIYDLDKNRDCDELVIKGLDVVRSTFPTAFRTFMTTLITDILDYQPKEVLDKKLLDFKITIPSLQFEDIAKSTSVNDLSKYNDKSASLTKFGKGTPAHVKAALVYNRLLKKLKKKANAPIRDGDKILWVYTKQNGYEIEQIAVKGFDDPKEILKFLKEYLDTDKIFDTEITKKAQKFYDALNWGLISTKINQRAQQFFAL